MPYLTIYEVALIYYPVLAAIGIPGKPLDQDPISVALTFRNPELFVFQFAKFQLSVFLILFCISKLTRIYDTLSICIPKLE